MLLLGIVDLETVIGVQACGYVPVAEDGNA